MEKARYLLFLCCWITMFHFASCVSVRLVSNLNHSFEGRVEVHYNGEWGTVCNNNWDMNDANVVCKMLGYQKALTIYYKFGQGSGRIWLDRVTCFGPESSIDQCCHRGWGIQNCTHQQDAGVICLPKAAHTEVKVRLTNTNMSYAGRVEVRYYGAWKPICDYSWDKRDSNVVCRMLGYKRGAAGVLRRLQGSGNVWLTGVYCRGYESSIQNCSHSTWGWWSCADNNLAGVVCISGNSTSNITFRLANNIIPNEGRLEVRYYGIWGPVCTYIDQSDAHVVCRMLGYSQAALMYKQAHTDGMYRFPLNMHCNGQESSIEQCGYYMGYINDCPNWNVWLVCQSPVHSSNVTVRLVNGTTPNKGRVEVGYRGTWGTICSFYWSLRAAHVVCRMLNYSKALSTGTTRVQGSGPIFVFGNCRGNEKSLQYCNTYRWDWQYCNHNSDVQVTCDNTTKEENSSVAVVRLVGYDHNNTGLVEVIYNGMWIPICDDYRWNMLGAHVVCRMLGYKGALQLLRQFGRRYSYLWMSNVECTGNEASINECFSYSWTRWCYGGNQAGVLCEVKDPAPIQVRLEDENTPGSGRVAVRYGNLWGNLCAWYGVDMNDARVICRMLGYPGASRVTSMYSYRLANTTIWQNSLQCNGKEKSIADCAPPRTGQRCRYFYSYYLSAVVCKKVEAPQFQIRGTNDVTDSTVEMVFNVSQSLGTKLQSLPFSAYQVVVKVKEVEHSSKSHERPGPLTIKEVDYRTALKQGYDSYVAAEILGPNIVQKLTIGDGKYYRGYFNAPLNAEHNYRIYVRVVTKSYYGKRVYGDLAFVSFTTKPKADAPQFRINGKGSITASSVEILFNGRQKREPQPTSVYQVTVEKKENERFFSSYDPTTPFIFHEANLTMAMTNKYKNYLTAEIPSSVSRLTVGDGQYYHGYYNAPLEPGCNYKIHVRTVKRSADGKQFHGLSSWVAFTTKQFGKPNTGKSTGEGKEKAPVIGLSVVIVVLILLVIGVIAWLVVKKRRTSEDCGTNEMSEIQGRSNPVAGSPQYDNLSFHSQTQDMGGFSNPVYNMSSEKRKKKGKKSETAPEHTEYQAPESVPRGEVNGLHDKQDQAYHVSDIEPQNPDEYKVDGNFNENASC